MILHQNDILFSDILMSASQHLSIPYALVEKDYWISCVLYQLAQSQYVNETVFKGGTSLSKAYKLIDRFSEDVDIALINQPSKTANEIKTIIRAIEKEITINVTEHYTEGVSSKGSRFRKTVFEYKPTQQQFSSNRIIVEINSFANPFPYQKQPIDSMVYHFLIQTNNKAIVDEYHLNPVELNVLNIEQTLLEKLISLLRYSFNEHAVASLSNKIRHFYDIYFLMQTPTCIQFVATDECKKQFHTLLNHDRTLFEEPDGWQTKAVGTSPLVNQFQDIWQSLKEKYQTELSALAFKPIPHESQIASCFQQLIQQLVR
jgi:predicted nucleotidyltransferase component of viral defense system